jgi:uncharacterized protein with HEPN domain
VPFRTPNDHLQDVLQAVDAIVTYTKSGKAEFARDPMIRDAVCARLIQIGQAVKDAQKDGLNLPKLRPEIAWSKVAGMRDLLAHKYGRLDPAIVWQVVQDDLPRLRIAVAAIFARAK